MRGPCFQRGDEAKVFEALLSHFEAHAAEWDWIQLSGFVEHGQAYQAMAQRGALESSWQVPNFLIQPGNNWEAYKTTLPPNLKESLRKCYTNLRRDNLQYEIRVVEGSDDVKESLDTFLNLHRLRAQSEAATKHADVFGSEPSKRFLCEYLVEAATAGSAKLFELVVEGEVVASRIGFVLGDSLYLYFSGYLPSMAKYSVMTTCTVEAMKWAIKKGLKTINLSMGRDRSKLRWRPIEVPFVEAQWASPTQRGQVFRHFGHAAKAMTGSRLSPAMRSLIRMAQRRQATLR
jgi:CelD/BcsL family acetyltransferase involved in cellulose biosynthesis